MDSNSKSNRFIYFSCTFTSESHFNPCLRMLKCPQKIWHCPDTGGKRNETVKIYSDPQPLELEGVPYHVVCQENCSPSPAEEAPTINRQDAKVCGSEFRCFQLNFQIFRHEWQCKETDGMHCSWSICYLLHHSKWTSESDSPKGLQTAKMSVLEVQWSSWKRWTPHVPGEKRHCQKE